MMFVGTIRICFLIAVLAPLRGSTLVLAETGSAEAWLAGCVAVAPNFAGPFVRVDGEKKDTGEPSASAATAQLSAPARGKPDSKPEADKKPPGEEPAAPWYASLDAVRRDARAQNRPILVRIGEQSCPWCGKLELEIGKTAVQDELARWACVALDVVQSAAAVRPFGVTATPALRILTPQGHLVAAHDGFMDADQLVQWLKQNHDRAVADPSDALFGDEPPTLLEVMRVVRQFRDPNAVVREAAIRRLRQYPKVAGSAVVRSLRQGNLSTKLAAYELLAAWKAPIDGIDPWQPDSVNAQRLGRLDAWLRKLDEDALKDLHGTGKKLTDQQRARLRVEINQMLKEDTLEAVAVRERIAQFGRAALPEVVARLQEAASDRQRTRLLALRYRLVVNSDLVLRWPGGLERLADVDPAVRHKAADQLAAMGDAGLQPLFLELFSDPDPLVRELSLKGLRNVGGRDATLALVKLLHDPEPNVRAAVLKQLTEDAPPEMLDKITEYVRWEKDPDLLVHAIRYFRAVRSAGAVASLLPLLKHKSWQVRAETAEALGKILAENRYSSRDNDTTAIYDALLGLLKDPDAFVVSRTLEGLHNVNAKRAVLPLVQAAGKHPDLAASIVDLLARGSRMRAAAVPRLRQFFASKDPAVRAAAIRGLTKTESDAIETELAAAVHDPASEVRTAAAQAALAMLEKLYPSDDAYPTDDASDFESEIDAKRRTIDPFSMVQAVAKSIGEMAGQSTGATRTVPQPAKKAVPRPKQGKDQTARLDESSMPKVSSARDPSKKQPNDSSAQPSGGKIVTKDVVVENPRGTETDKWLAELYAGRHRPPWTSNLVKPFQDMLVAKQPEERLAAAQVLIPLGQADQAVPVLLQCARTGPELLLQSGQSLHWLVWERRVALFEKLDAFASDDSQHVGLIESMNHGTDERLAGFYWKYLDREKLARGVVSAIQYGMRSAYLGRNNYDPDKITNAMRRRVAKAAGPEARSGSTAKRLVAVDLLLDVAADDALIAAQAIATDATADPKLRNDAFQMILAAQPTQDRLKTAIAALADKDPHRLHVALKYLALGADALRHLPETDFGISVSGHSNIVSFGSGKPIIPKPPARLRAAQVHAIPLKLDAEDAAYAGYLLTMFGEPEGLDPLIRYWRGAEPDGGLDRLVVEAIAVLDDSSHIDELKKIYGRVKEDYDVRDFYWTIRIMSGPAMLRFRKQIRSEVGMSKLQ